MELKNTKKISKTIEKNLPLIVEEIKEYIVENEIEFEVEPAPYNSYIPEYNDFDDEFEYDEDNDELIIKFIANLSDGYNEMRPDCDCSISFSLIHVLMGKWENDIKNNLYDFDYEEIEDSDEIDSNLNDKISEVFNYLNYLEICDNMDTYDADEEDDAFVNGFDNSYDYSDYNDGFSGMGWYKDDGCVIIRCMPNDGSGYMSKYKIPIDSLDDDSYQDEIEYLGYEMM